MDGDEIGFFSYTNIQLELSYTCGEDSDNFADNEYEEEYKNISSDIGDDFGLAIIERSLTAFDARLQDLQNCQDSLNRKADDLQREIAELEANKDASDIMQRYERVQERVIRCKIAALAMKNSGSQFTVFSRAQAQRWRRAFTIQHDRCTLFEKMIEELAGQLRQLEYLGKQNPQSSIVSTGLNTANAAIEAPISAFDGNASSQLNIPGQAVRIRPGVAKPFTSNSTSSHPTTPVTTGVDVLSALVSNQDTHDALSPSSLTCSLDHSPPTGTPSLEKPLPGLPVTTKEEYRVPVDSEVNEDRYDDEDYFYDAEDFSPDFSIYLPFSSSTSAAGDRTVDMMTAISRGQSQEKANGSDLDIPAGTDLANEYESDVESNSETELAEKANRLMKNKRFCEAGVVRCRLNKQGHEAVAGLEPVRTPNTSTKATDSSTFVPIRSAHPGRRTKIPPKPKISLNLWTIMRNCIGKELTKIPMPVNFSEPLSMLQRLTEDFAYSSLLDKAANCDDTLEQMAYVAAFTVSAYATTAVRIGKPFNPLLSETYECDRTDDLGWRCLAEQVSHHPPICALHCESNQWYCWFQFSMTTQFRGKYLQIFPLGTVHLVFRKTGHHYVWEKIPLTVHNIIVGQLWIDNSGEMEIVNLNTSEKCHLSYKAYSYFSSVTPRSVTGGITDKKGAASHVLKGTWDGKIECARVLNTRYARDSGKPILETSPPSVLWSALPLHEDAKLMYFFNEFAVQLNQPEDGVCPTDSRFRPDQRLMEAGRWDEANQAKKVLEDKQRQRRRVAALALMSTDSDGRGGDSGKGSVPVSGRLADFLESVDNAHKPLWFERRLDPDTERQIFFFTGDYWTRKAAQDWSNLPDIY